MPAPQSCPTVALETGNRQSLLTGADRRPMRTADLQPYAGLGAQKPGAGFRPRTLPSWPKPKSDCTASPDLKGRAPRYVIVAEKRSPSRRAREIAFTAIAALYLAAITLIVHYLPVPTRPILPAKRFDKRNFAFYLADGAVRQPPAARPEDPRHSPGGRALRWARRWASFMWRAISRPRPRLQGQSNWFPTCSKFL